MDRVESLKRQVALKQLERAKDLVREARHMACGAGESSDPLYHTLSHCVADINKAMIEIESANKEDQ